MKRLLFCYSAYWALWYSLVSGHCIPFCNVLKTCFGLFVSDEMKPFSFWCRGTYREELEGQAEVDCSSCTAGYYCNNTGNVEPVQCGKSLYSVSSGNLCTSPNLSDNCFHTERLSVREVFQPECFKYCLYLVKFTFHNEFLTKQRWGNIISFSKLITNQKDLGPIS